MSFCERDNVSREVFYHRGVRHGFYRSCLKAHYYGWRLGFKPYLFGIATSQLSQFKCVNCVSVTGSLVLVGNQVLVSSGPSEGSKGAGRLATIGNGTW